MAELKTQKTTASVKAFLDTIADEQRRADCFAVVEMMKQATNAEPTMWGTAIVGFGHYHYRYASGRENDWFLIGFSPRKQDLTLYFCDGLQPYTDLLKQLGKHKASKSCVYIKRLTDIDLTVLQQMMQQSVTNIKTTGIPGEHKA
ncbi:MAG: DUF1801 domain-containing protein [Blastocatellia bacterium]